MSSTNSTSNLERVATQRNDYPKLSTTTSGNWQRNAAIIVTICANILGMGLGCGGVDPTITILSVIGFEVVGLWGGGRIVEWLTGEQRLWGVASRKITEISKPLLVEGESQ